MKEIALEFLPIYMYDCHWIFTQNEEVAKPHLGLCKKMNKK